MNKIVLCLVVIISLIMQINVNVVHASQGEIDDTVNGILDGIDYENLKEIESALNNFFGEDISIKERIISFFKGEANLSLNTFKNYFLGRVNSAINSIIKFLTYVLFIGILCYTLNIISLKNNDNIENNTIFYICYSLIITASTVLISNVFQNVKNALVTISTTTEIFFPLMFSISSLCGNFGVELYKPITFFVSFFSSRIVCEFFIPILSIGVVAIIVSNLSTQDRLSGLSKTIFSFFKWALGFITVIFSITLIVQGSINAQYNGASVKILKYATGSLIPIVGGFLSGGIDLMLSCAVLIKNSLGLVGVIYILLVVVGSGLELVILAFMLRFFSSICQPIIDKRFFGVLNGLADTLTYLSCLIFLCGYMFFICVLGFVFSTISVF